MNEMRKSFRDDNITIVDASVAALVYLSKDKVMPKDECLLVTNWCRTIILDDISGGDIDEGVAIRSYALVDRLMSDDDVGGRKNETVHERQKRMVRCGTGGLRKACDVVATTSGQNEELMQQVGRYRKAADGAESWIAHPENYIGEMRTETTTEAGRHQATDDPTSGGRSDDAFIAALCYAMAQDALVTVLVDATDDIVWDGLGKKTTIEHERRMVALGAARLDIAFDAVQQIYGNDVAIAEQLERYRNIVLRAEEWIWEPGNCLGRVPTQTTPGT